MEYICKKCNKKMMLDEMYSKSKCLSCERDYQASYRKNNKSKYNKYMKEYMRTKRWLNGGPDNFLLGEEKNINLRSWDGELKIKIKNV